MRWLVVNADDAGFAEPTDAAILRCARAGIVRSATVAANGPTADAFVRQALDAGLDLGLHVNLTGGRPLAGPHGLAFLDEGHDPPRNQPGTRSSSEAVHRTWVLPNLTRQDPSA